MQTVAILDTSALMSLYCVGLLDKMQLFYQKVLIPNKVEAEFIHSNLDIFDTGTERYDFLENFYSRHSSWFERCNEYGEDLIALYKMADGIDDGEAEVFAQNQHWESVCTLILDEKKARAYAELNQLRKRGVLGLLAEMELVWDCCDYQTATQTLIDKRKAHLTAKIIRYAWNETKKSLGL